MFNFKDVEIKGYAVLLVILAYTAVLAGIALIMTVVQNNRGKKFYFETRDLTYGGICLAIAIALDFVTLIKMPQGGSITIFAVLPIIIYCYYFGFQKGLLVTMAYTLLQLMNSPYIVHPFSLVLDYLIPYSALSLTGLFAYNRKRYANALNKGKIGLSAHYPVFIMSAVYILIRYASHVISGIVFYGEWAWEGWGVVPYSFAYNSTCLIDFGIAMVGLTGLLLSKTFNTFMATHRNTLQNTDTSAENY